MVAIDSTFFPYLFNHPTRIPKDPATDKPVEVINERINLLIETLQEDKETIIIPTPALSEFLVLAKQDGPKYLKEFTTNALYAIKPFDIIAAIELAAIRLDMEKKLSKRELKAQSPESTYAKICFDRQIIAIAKANNAHTIYSEDSGVAAFATNLGIKVVQVWTLPKPKDTQIPFPFLNSAPNVIQIPAHSTNKETDGDKQGNYKESVEEDVNEIGSTGNGAIPEFLATSQDVGINAESGDQSTEANPPA